MSKDTKGSHSFGSSEWIHLLDNGDQNGTLSHSFGSSEWIHQSRIMAKPLDKSRTALAALNGFIKMDKTAATSIFMSHSFGSSEWIHHLRRLHCETSSLSHSFGSSEWIHREIPMSPIRAVCRTALAALNGFIRTPVTA